MNGVEINSASALPWIIDGVALLIIAGAGIAGLVKGAVRILGAVAGFIAAIILGWRFTPLLAEVIGPRINSVVFGKILAFLAIFIAVMLVTALLVFLLKKLFDAILLGWLNKLLGFILGALIGTFVVCVALWISLQLYPELSDFYASTRLVRLLVWIVYALVPGLKAMAYASPS